MDLDDWLWMNERMESSVGQLYTHTHRFARPHTNHHSNDESTSSSSRSVRVNPGRKNQQNKKLSMSNHGNTPNLCGKKKTHTQEKTIVGEGVDRALLGSLTHSEMN